jgi:hypothetical protein
MCRALWPTQNAVQFPERQLYQNHSHTPLHCTIDRTTCFPTTAAQRKHGLTKYNPNDYSANRTSTPLDFNTARSTSSGTASATKASTTIHHCPTQTMNDIYTSLSAPASPTSAREAFDIDRGLWDIKRSPQPGPSLPPPHKSLKQPLPQD